MEKALSIFWILFILIPVFAASSILTKIMTFLLPIGGFLIYKINYWYILVGIITLFYTLILNRAIRVKISGWSKIGNYVAGDEGYIYFKVKFLLVIAVLFLIFFHNFIYFLFVFWYNGKKVLRQIIEKLLIKYIFFIRRG